MAYKNLIENLSKEIKLFQKMGGNIYSYAKGLPFYERMRSAGKSYFRETGEKISTEQIYAECGIKFNKDYYKFTEIMGKLDKYASPEGYVDCIKRTNASAEETEIRSYLSHHSRQANLTPGEFLILMTDYRFETLTVAGDYVSYLQKRFDTECPDGTVKNLKADNTSLYWALKHFQKYSPVELSYEEALAFFGVTNISAHKPQDPTTKINEAEVLEELKEMYPDGQIKSLFDTDKKLYFQAIKLSLKHDQTLTQWFNSHGLNYTQGAANGRLSKYQVDANEHEQLLLSLRDKYLKEYDTENADEVDLYEINLEIAKKIGKELYGEKVEYVKEFGENSTAVTSENNAEVKEQFDEKACPDQPITETPDINKVQ